MGTPSGLRTRKYHGFGLTLPGRRETAFLSDLEFSVDDRALWPHLYTSDTSDSGGAAGVVDHPEAAMACRQSFQLSDDGAPSWSWKIEDQGLLRFGVSSPSPGVISLVWNWTDEGSGPTSQSKSKSKSKKASPPVLRVRPFFAFRSIHSEGGSAWRLEAASSTGCYRAVREVTEGALSASAGTTAGEYWVRWWSSRRNFAKQLHWIEQPFWYRNFFYSEEAERGYNSSEDLFTEGYWEFPLASGRFELRLAAEEKTVQRAAKSKAVYRGGVWDFALEEPPGVCAGFPWFGEWGRDTFIALPGIVAARSAAGDSEREIYLWAESVLGRWENWILAEGMIPNLLGGPEGEPQWESCDATLWWSHALASIWAHYLDRPQWADRLKSRFLRPLGAAIQAIQKGRHRFLRLEGDESLFVEARSEGEAYSTWMDARSGGRAVTPRVGRLPEINALWFQERCLQNLWRNASGPSDLAALLRLAGVAMTCKEIDRPNEVFLYSLPLAPAFVLGAWQRTAESAPGGPESSIAARLRPLIAPCGLRTLSPENPAFEPKCQGTQTERDRAYHQGTIWPWLGAHFEMARLRAMGDSEVPAAELHSPGFSGAQPIPGHIPEIFDATAPYQWRGTPAQAWSLACFEELKDRARRGTDDRLRSLLVATKERPGS